MVLQDPDPDELLQRAGRGEDAAWQRLLVVHRDRLCRMVAVRLDRRLAARFGPSDVVQEALLDADQRLSDYLEQRPLPFYPWLRQLAWEHLLKLNQRHLTARKRSANREERQAFALPDASALELAQRLVSQGTSPSNRLLRDEVRGRVQAALVRLPEGDREGLVLRYLEQLSMGEVAAVLEITEGAVKMRHTRALARLCGLLGGQAENQS